MNPEEIFQRRLRARYLSRVRTPQSLASCDEQGATLNFYEHPERGTVEVVVERAVVCPCGQLRRAAGPRLPEGNPAHQCACGAWTAPAQRFLPLPTTDRSGWDGVLRIPQVAAEWNDAAACATMEALQESLDFYGPAYEEGTST